MAVSTWLLWPLAQAEPAETQICASCRMLMEFWVGTPNGYAENMGGFMGAAFRLHPGQGFS